MHQWTFRRNASTNLDGKAQNEVCHLPAQTIQRADKTRIASAKCSRTAFGITTRSGVDCHHDWRIIQSNLTLILLGGG